MLFGERLRDLRNEKKLSLLSLSKELGVSHSTLLRWEKEEILPSIEHLYNIAVYFGVSSDYLIGLEN